MAVNNPAAVAIDAIDICQWIWLARRYRYRSAPTRPRRNMPPCRACPGDFYGPISQFAGVACRAFGQIRPRPGRFEDVAPLSRGCPHHTHAHLHTPPRNKKNRNGKKSRRRPIGVGIGWPLSDFALGMPRRKRTAAVSGETALAEVIGSLSTPSLTPAQIDGIYERLEGAVEQVGAPTGTSRRSDF